MLVTPDGPGAPVFLSVVSTLASSVLVISSSIVSVLSGLKQRVFSGSNSSFSQAGRVTGSIFVEATWAL